MAEEVKIAKEIKEMAREPLLPVEKKLILWSLAIGIVCLGLLIWISYTLFPAGH